MSGECVDCGRAVKDFPLRDVRIRCNACLKKRWMKFAKDLREKYGLTSKVDQPIIVEGKE